MRKQTYSLYHENSVIMMKAICIKLGHRYPDRVFQFAHECKLIVNIIQAQLPVIVIITTSSSNYHIRMLGINKEGVYDFTLIPDSVTYRHTINLNKHIAILNYMIRELKNYTYYLSNVLEMQKVIERTANDLNVQPEIFE